jgi:FSR family fosmidomycin resistance protein-like MFS transporter
VRLSLRLPANQATTEGTRAAGIDISPELERTLILWVNNASHAVNHFQNQIISTLYPVIMAELGFGYIQLGAITAIRTVFGNASQLAYGFLTPFIGRTRLLGIANLGMGLGSLFTGAVGGYPDFVAARTVTSVASSAQHPVGASLLSHYFPRRRGTVLALNSSVANIGSLLAPAAAGLLLLLVGWRQIFFVAALLCIVVGVAFFFLRDSSDAGSHGLSSRSRLTQGKASYLRALRNRNIVVISLVQMVGAAGGEGGVNQTYIGPHLVNDLGFSVATAGLALSVFTAGGVVGPLGFGWLSDRVVRQRVIQASLVLSAIGTLALAHQDVIQSVTADVLGPWWTSPSDLVLPLLLITLLFYGAVTSSRQTLTQALVADSIGDEDRDAAFSLYYFIAFFSDPIWSLVTGILMENFGFSFAFSRLAITYAIGMALLFLLRSPRAEVRHTG